MRASARGQAFPHLFIAHIGEQCRGQQQVDHRAGGQRADPTLGAVGVAQHLINHVRRDHTRQIPQVSSGERATIIVVGQDSRGTL
nr:hypothetical protein [Gordonia asplenii]